MATKDTGGQKRASKRDADQEQVEGQESSDLAERKEQLDEDIDAILDEIDETLETNAEEFVRGFVQKGGQ
jgi:prokaryotic ubiquitin-like protein Pup